MYRYKIKPINDNDNDNSIKYSDNSIKVLYDIFNSPNVPIVITETKYPFRIKYINEAWQKLSGYSIQELYQQSIYYIRIGKINNLIINKKKDGILFEHEFDIIEIQSLNIKIGITKKIKIINLNQYHLLNKYIYNDLEKI